LGIHGLRHSLATLMAIQGAAAPQIMAALGHRQLSTAARYIKTVEDARQDVMEKHTAGISAALSGNKGSKVARLRKSTDGK
jgi:site-specific recombinase XerD